MFKKSQTFNYAKIIMALVTIHLEKPLKDAKQQLELESILNNSNALYGFLRMYHKRAKKTQNFLPVLSTLFLCCKNNNPKILRETLRKENKRLFHEFLPLIVSIIKENKNIRKLFEELEICPKRETALNTQISFFVGVTTEPFPNVWDTKRYWSQHKSTPNFLYSVKKYKKAHGKNRAPVFSTFPLFSTINTEHQQLIVAFEEYSRLTHRDSAIYMDTKGRLSHRSQEKNPRRSYSFLSK